MEGELSLWTATNTKTRSHAGWIFDENLFHLYEQYQWIKWTDLVQKKLYELCNSNINPNLFEAMFTNFEQNKQIRLSRARRYRSLYMPWKF